MVSSIDDSMIKGEFINQANVRRILGSEGSSDRQIDGCSYDEIDNGECAAAKKYFTWFV